MAGQSAVEHGEGVVQASGIKVHPRQGIENPRSRVLLKNLLVQSDLFLHAGLSG
jgi:hypothetical protein